MGGNSGGGGNGGRSGGGGQSEAPKSTLTPQQIGTAQGKLATIIESTLNDKYGDSKLTSYQANSLNFLASNAGRKTPLSEKQAAWMGKLAREAAQHNPKLGQSYLGEKVLKQVGL